MRLENHELIQIGEMGKVIPTESITVFETPLLCVVVMVECVDCPKKCEDGFLCSSV